ncbi:DUF5132 domain-containing protein [Geminocystis sp. CENA526]|uniref:DUF5132 domain-containing protein n=1 Tax=Geminocystis sp. CENA526 TaxID=1355871 RepID=UPI003D6ED214
MLDKIRNMYQDDPIKTIAIGVGAIILAPTIASLVKPVAKATIKTGVILYQKTKETIAETSEQIGDLVAEAKAEVLAEAEKKQDTITVSSTPSD